MPTQFQNPQEGILDCNTEGSPPLHTTLVDFGVQKHNEIRLTILHGITQQILSEQSLNEIYQFLCEKLVQFGYPAAFVGLKEPDGSINIIAQEGIENSDIKNFKIRWDDTPEGFGMVGEAIRTGKPQTSNIEGNRRFKQWRELLEKLNLHSIATFPLKAHDQILGAFAIYARVPNYFTSFHISLLQTLAEQVAIAILSHHDRYQLKIQNTALIAAANAIVITDREGIIIWANPAFTHLTGYTSESVLKKNPRFLRSGYHDRSFYKKMWDTILAGQTWQGELVNRREDGTFYHEEMTITPVQADKSEITHFIAIKQDVSERRAMLNALRDSEERYREMFENMRNAVVILEASEDGQGFLVKAFNRVARDMEKITSRVRLGQPIESAFPVIKALGLETVLCQVYSSGQSVSFPATYFQHESISGWREGFIYKLTTREIVILYEDVTKRKQDEDSLWLEKERAQITLASIGDAVITTDVGGRIIYLNPVAETLTGWTCDQTKGLDLLEVFNIVNENTGQKVDNPVRQCIKEKRIVELADQTLLLHRDGHTYAIEDTAAPIYDKEGRVIGAVLVFHDVSDKRELLRQLYHQAHHDVLTGLPNRLLLNDRAHQAIIKAHRCGNQIAILFIDLDGFKLINDTLGHSRGDQILKITGERLRSCLREVDTVARQGGDEFLILLPESNSDCSAAVVAQKILEKFAEPFRLNEQEIYVSASIGIALYPLDGEDVETLVRNADTAMYHAKDEGRNHFQFYTLELNQNLSKRLALRNDLRRALERQEFLLYYQPQYRLSDGHLCGMEALVRWQHPERGLLLPGEFIPIAEESGLILTLGEWILREACAKNKLLQKKGYPYLQIAVNLSPRQFRQVNLLHQVGNILKETGLEPQWLELEITESMSMENLDHSLTLLQDLKDMGIKLAMDDFGTGFSSLGYLSRFPLDTIKIDRSFVSDMLPSR